MEKPQTALPAKNEARLWFEIDASKKPLGRVATQIATILRGKHKRNFRPNRDMGDFVVAVNIDRLKFTGRKVQQKKYYRHSGYLGGLKELSLKNVLQRNPGEALKKAVFSMLDEVKFRKQMMARLKIARGGEHGFSINKKF